VSVPAAGEPAAGGTPASGASVDPDAFRRVVGQFATGVTVVTACVDGVDHAMTASAFTSVSLDPVLVLVCVDKDARFHEAILEAGSWAVSVLDASGRRAAEWFAARGRPLIGQMDRVPHHRGPVSGAALLESSLAWLECRTTAVYDGGDHDIVVGEVLAVEHGPADGVPLVYYRGSYRELS
jgi:flavin reductase (DIM6/NTAB) family NADH-FMN oxidoreductase RutF